MRSATEETENVATTSGTSGGTGSGVSSSSNDSNVAIECDEHAYLEETYQICVCDEGWYKDTQTGLCTSEQNHFD